MDTVARAVGARRWCSTRGVGLVRRRRGAGDAVAVRRAPLRRALPCRDVDTGEGLVRFGRHLGAHPAAQHRGRDRAAPALGAFIGVDSTTCARSARHSAGRVNDVVLAAVAAATATLLLGRGEDADAAVVRTLVPVSMRSEDAHGVLDNRVSAMLLELPGARRPTRSSAAAGARADGRELKESHMAEAGGVVTAVGDLAPPMVVGTMSRLAITRAPPTPATLGQHGDDQRSRARSSRCTAWAARCSSTARSSRSCTGSESAPRSSPTTGELAFGITGDFDTAPDVDVLAAAIAAGITDLHALAVEKDAVEKDAGP